MPRISRFYGIAIAMFVDDHGPPHFHAIYAEYKGSIEIGSGKLIRGHLPRPQLALVQKWALLHRAELSANWRRARRGQPLAKIDPLP